ncbi:hypothetical protein DFH08DRAFT_811926 [Mycena albidolilacea]|uniref:RING-type domain-containing protein n=1 Tax=Mycena albidolilacea TaxID=1033008 RepID=A0AAD7EMR1_9AGAR|nr:hypothetical protein DFH08DRAFT_811926 [Mycena albidolilacea]
MPCGHGRAIARSPAAEFAHPAISSISTFASAECSPILGWEEAISTVETEIFATKLSESSPIPLTLVRGADLDGRENKIFATYLCGLSGHWAQDCPYGSLNKSGQDICFNIAPVGQARRTEIPIAKALRAGIFAISDEYAQREPTGVNEYDEPMPQAGFDPDPSTLRCPICFDTVCRPVVTLCLHVFCDEWIYKSLRDNSLAGPICRVSITQPPEPDAILEGHLERAVAEGVVAVPSDGRSILIPGEMWSTKIIEGNILSTVVSVRTRQPIEFPSSSIRVVEFFLD